MAWPTQCSGGCWAVGNPKRTPTTGQKQLRGKNGKSCHNKQYKKVIEMHSEQQWNNRRTTTTTEKKENKENKKTESEEEKYK